MAQGVIAQDDADLLRRAETARQDVIQVDSFTLDEYRAGAQVDGPAPTPAADVTASRDAETADSKTS